MSALPARSPPPARVGSIGAAVRLMDALGQEPPDSVVRKRRLVAGLCRMLGEQVGANEGVPGCSPASADGAAPSPTQAVALSPRMRQTLERLLAGDSEKEIAARLGLSRHTVHVYVKTLYRRFGVNSRGELLARFVQRGGVNPT